MKLLILSVICILSCSSSKNIITMTVLNNQPIPVNKQDSTILITIELENHTTQNYLIYGFGHFRYDVGSVPDVCKSYYLKIVFAFYDSVYSPYLYKVTDTGVISRSNEINFQQQALYKHRRNDYPEVLVLPAKKRITFNRLIYLESITFTDFEIENLPKLKAELEKHSKPSYFKIAYHSPDAFDENLNVNIVHNDEVNFKAILFKGCLTSDYIKIDYR